jgi:hypothetical protein
MEIDLRQHRTKIAVIFYAWSVGGFFYTLCLLQTAYGSKSMEIFFSLIALLGVMLGYFYFGYMVAKDGEPKKQTTVVTENGSGN